jgi:hypothetical protein
LLHVTLDFMSFLFKHASCILNDIRRNCKCFLPLL